MTQGFVELDDKCNSNLKAANRGSKIYNGESEEDVGDWGKSVAARIEQVDAKVTSLSKVIGDLEMEKESETTRGAMQVSKYYTTRPIGI